MAIKHTHVVDIVTYPNDVTDPRVQGNEWNDDHTLGADENFVSDAQLAALASHVSSSAVITDHAIVRGDGGAKGVQDSGVLIDDSDNLSTPGDISILGAELITDGTFDTACGAGNWTCGGAGVSIAGGLGVFTAAGNLQQLYQAISALAAYSYQVTYDVVSISAGAVRIKLGTTFGTVRSTTGTFTDDFTFFGTVAGNFHIYSSGATTTATVDNVSIKRVFFHAKKDGDLLATGVATLGDSSQLATSAAPTADADIANKKYVDDNTAIVYDYQQKEVGATYIYWGFDSTGTGYRIVRQTIIGGAWAESIGTYPTPYANYAAAWAARAALSYT